jgi:hypothetical protein
MFPCLHNPGVEPHQNMVVMESAVVRRTMSLSWRLMILLLMLKCKVPLQDISEFKQDISEYEVPLQDLSEYKVLLQDIREYKFSM